MSVLYPLIQALVLFAVAPLLSGITRVARARLHNRRGAGCVAGVSRHYQTAGPPERWPGCLRLGVPPDAVCDGWASC
ncbi:formate hydrogenlyase subunit 4 [Escherichia coli]|uniref:Formate hydrogenlyase subunit 4 n=1 Tax=Escherichia coli TaxID=562 RepID=A0A484YW87_ECOLX|nr:formate hydrogenlyase subunit 4 [Escherichia coli]